MRTFTMELTRIYFDYANETYSTVNEYVGDNDSLNFATALTIQRQELASLAEEGLIEWKTAFELEGDFTAWNDLVDAFEG